MRGAATRAIQELAGHQDIGTTQRYMHLSPAAVRSAMDLLEQPAPTGTRGDILETEECGIANVRAQNDLRSEPRWNRTAHPTGREAPHQIGPDQSPRDFLATSSGSKAPSAFI